MTDKESNTGKFYTNYSFEYPKFFVLRKKKYTKSK